MKTLMTSVATLTLAALLSTAAQAQTAPDFDFTSANASGDGHVIVFMDDDGEMSPSVTALDSELGGAFSAALAQQEYEPKFGSKMTFSSMGPYKTITVIGAGSESLSAPKLAELGGRASAAAGKGDAYVLTDDIDDAAGGMSAYIAQGYAMRSYSFDKYKQGYDANAAAPKVTIATPDMDAAASLYNDDLSYVVEGIYFSRNMGTEPGNKIWPQEFANRARDLFRGVPNTSMRVIGVSEMERMNMGALMGVGKGSIHDPKLVIVTYNGDPDGSAPIALVGKGITFDTGGISIKPNTGMWLMKSDLSGAASVAGTVYAAAQRGEKINLVGVMAMAENMPDGKAIRVGDVLTTMGGKTIEVMSTDAEGRLVLSDAVQYAQSEYDPSLVLTIATLTGSAGRALGTDYAALVTRDLEGSLSYVATGEAAGEPVWPLPLNDSHYKAIKSNIADIKSTGGSPGASIGGAVIGTFIDDDQDWIHLDIAGVDWLDGGNAVTPKGHAGWGVRYMDQLVREKAAE